MNGKGRFSLAIQPEGTARIPAEEDWKTPPMNDALMLDHLRHNGAIRGTNIFFRAQLIRTQQHQTNTTSWCRVRLSPQHANAQDDGEQV